MEAKSTILGILTTLHRPPDHLFFLLPAVQSIDLLYHVAVAKPPCPWLDLDPNLYGHADFSAMTHTHLCNVERHVFRSGELTSHTRGAMLCRFCIRWGSYGRCNTTIWRYLFPWLMINNSTLSMKAMQLFQPYSTAPRFQFPQ